MLWEHQVMLAQKAEQILRERKVVYLAMEMRVGKTLIALELCRLMGFRNVFFVTKKKAIGSIKNDYYRENYHLCFHLDVVNYEQMHKSDPKGYEAVIVDEAHSLGAFPKPSGRTKKMKEFVQSKYLVLLSGTPTPESFSQIYHQFWISRYSPFGEKNFYEWAKKYVKKKEKLINGLLVNDYSNARKDLIARIVSPYLLTFTQREAGFNFLSIDDEVFVVRGKPIVYDIMARLIKNRYVRVEKGGVVYEIVADSAAKLSQKIHQVCSGTVITEEGVALVLDRTKADYIRRRFGDNGFAVYYKFRAEGEVLRQVFPLHTSDPAEFARNPGLVFLSQIQSGSMGIDLSMATAIVFYNIDYSFTHYWQARARIQNRALVQYPRIYWVFIEGGIEQKILNVVRRKRNYTSFYFKRDFLGLGKENSKG